jgi:hypothetical protein
LERAQKRQKELYDRNRYKARIFLPGYRVLKKVAADIVSFATAKWSDPRTIVAATNAEHTAYRLSRIKNGRNTSTTAKVGQLREYVESPTQVGE